MVIARSVDVGDWRKFLERHVNVDPTKISHMECLWPGCGYKLMMPWSEKTRTRGDRPHGADCPIAEWEAKTMTLLDRVCRAMKGFEWYFGSDDDVGIRSECNEGPMERCPLGALGEFGVQPAPGEEGIGDAAIVIMVNADCQTREHARSWGRLWGIPDVEDLLDPEIRGRLLQAAGLDESEAGNPL